MIREDSATQMAKMPMKMYHMSKLSWFRMCVIMYDVPLCSSDSSLPLRSGYNPNDLSSYVFDDRIAMATGYAEMYIMTSKLSCTAGFTSARLNVAVPVCLALTA